MRDKRILITGGAGFIGSKLTKSLVQQGAKVTIIDDLSTGYKENIASVLHQIDFKYGRLQDFLKEGKVKTGDYDFIFHLAANTYIPPSVDNPAFDYDQNLNATFLLLELLRKSKERPHFIYASSAAVYGNPSQLPISENSALDPISPYGVSKLAAERYAYVFSQLYGMKITSLRFFSVYGPGQHKQVIYELIEKLRATPNKLKVFGNGKQVRDFIYVDDLVSAIILVAKKSKGSGEVYNLSSGKAYSIKDVVSKICKVCSLAPKVVYSGKSRPGDAEKWIVDNSKLLKLGFKNKHSLDDGIKLVKKWADLEALSIQKNKVRILVVGDSASIHTARFVSLLQDIGYEVQIFQVELHCSVDEHLENTIVHVLTPYDEGLRDNKIVSFSPIVELIKKLPPAFSGKIFSAVRYTYHVKRYPRVKHLIKLIGSYNPDIIISLKMQNDGYTVSMAKDRMKKTFKAKWIHFSWGTDIEFFGKHSKYKKKHLPKIKKLLKGCDFHMADTDRDVRQAKELGFCGTNLGKWLAPGGFDLEQLREIRKKVRKRDVILIKGRQGGHVGKSLNILAALHQIPHLIKRYKIKIINFTPETEAAARLLSQTDKINYELVDRLPYNDLLNLFARSRIAISASDVDGTPSFLIEAMALGALPIHSDMESIREWINDGENGLLFPVDDIGKLAACIKKGLTDKTLFEKAQKINWKIAHKDLDRKKIQNQLQDMIENIFQGNSK